jgi:hypothetical protein
LYGFVGGATAAAWGGRLVERGTAARARLTKAARSSGGTSSRAARSSGQADDVDVVVVLSNPIEDTQEVFYGSLMLEIILKHIDAHRDLVDATGGKVLFAPLRVQIRPGKYREPDLLMVLGASDPRRQNEYWLGADLVMEIVNPDKPRRDTEEKPNDYAEADIPEYWIINPLTNTITVLVLQDGAYIEYGVFHRSEQARSKLLDGFCVNVNDVLDAK